jgi:hypothetical protein
MHFIDHYRRIALPPFRPAKIFVQSIRFGQNISLINSFWRKIFLIDPFWRFLARFLARLKKLMSFCWRHLRCVSGAGEWGAREAGAPSGGRGASIFLGGGDPFQPEIFVEFIRFSAFSSQKYWFSDPRRPEICFNRSAFWAKIMVSRSAPAQNN